MRYPQVWLRVKKMEDSNEPIVVLEVSRQVVLALHRRYFDKAEIGVLDVLFVALDFHEEACRQVREWYSTYVLPWPQVRIPALKIKFEPPPDDTSLEVVHEIPVLEDEEEEEEEARS